MKVKHVRIAAGFGLVAGMLLFSWAGLHGEQQASADKITTRQSAKADESNEANPVPKSDSGAAPAHVGPSTPRPPAATLSFPEIIDELKRRADAGDSRAACHLGSKLGLCTHFLLPGMSKMSDELMATMLAAGSHTPEELEEKLQRHVASRERATEILSNCEALSVAQIAQAPNYLLQSAQAGNIQSMLRIANGPVSATAPQFVANPNLAMLYQQHSMPMLLRAFEAGEPDAAVALATLVQTANTRDLVAQLPAPLQSAEAVLALRALLEQRFDPTARVANPRTPFTPEALEAAQSLYERYFERSPRWENSTFVAIRIRNKANPQTAGWDIEPIESNNCDDLW